MKKAIWPPQNHHSEPATDHLSKYGVTHTYCQNCQKGGKAPLTYCQNCQKTLLTVKTVTGRGIFLKHKRQNS